MLCDRRYIEYYVPSYYVATTNLKFLKCFVVQNIPNNTSVPLTLHYLHSAVIASFNSLTCKGLNSNYEIL